MKATDWKRLVTPALGEGWATSKALAYKVPVGWVLHGLLAEDSAAVRPAFYLWNVRMPLVVPTDVVDLSWSERFGGSSQFFDPSADSTREALVQAARKVERASSSAADAALVDPPGGGENVRMQEARAYGLLLENNMSEAAEVLRTVIRYEARYPWEKELVQRAESMRLLILDRRIDEAIERIGGWRAETLHALGIESKRRSK
ncbi:MAG: hypothetical protein ACT4QG_22860 [Sporichthyaceae bacterium]